MSGTILVAALGICSALLLFLFFKLGDEQKEESGWTKYPLQIIILGFLLGMIVLLGKATLDYNDNCAWLVNNSTSLSNSTTSYQYSYSCSTNTNTTASAFYQLTLWIMRLVTAYLVLAFAFELILYLGWWKKGGKQE